MAIEAPYMFLDPSTLLNEEEKLWLARASIADISPLWLEKVRDHRSYGGAEDVVLNIITQLTNFGVGEQHIFGNPKDKILERRFPNLKAYFPSRPDYRTKDLFDILQTNQEEARSLEYEYVFDSYQRILRMSPLPTIVHDHTVIGRDLSYFIHDLPTVRTEHGPLAGPDISPIDTGHIESLHDARNMYAVAISESQIAEANLNWIGVVHNGVDLNDFEYSEEKRGDDSGNPYILFLGRICRNKGPHHAIRIGKELGIKVILAGHVEQTDDSRSYFAHEVKPHIDDIHVIHHPGVAAPERKKLMRDASCFIMMIDWHEPFGLVAVEALASGTPVVARDMGAMSEIIEDGISGYLVEEDEAGIDATDLILQGNYDPKAGRRKVEMEFSAPVNVRNYVRVYREAEKRFTGESKATGLMDLKTQAA